MRHRKEWLVGQCGNESRAKEGTTTTRAGKLGLRRGDGRVRCRRYLK